MNLYGIKTKKEIKLEVLKMGVMEQSRQMKFVMNKMSEAMKSVKKEMEPIIQNQNEQMRGLVSCWNVLEAMWIKMGYPKEEMPKPIVDMTLENP